MHTIICVAAATRKWEWRLLPKYWSHKSDENPLNTHRAMGPCCALCSGFGRTEATSCCARLLGG